jgi:hypothetical protein
MEDIAPPAGPGAPPAERLAAFYAAMAELLGRHLHLALGAETGPRRFATGPTGFWHAHVHAPLAPELYRHQRDRGRSAADVTAALTRPARTTLGRPAGDRATADPGVGVQPSTGRS